MFRYLGGTSEYGLLYSQDLSQPGCFDKLYTDSDWEGDRNGRKSTEGYDIYVWSNLIGWRSSLRKTVALSSAEAEYIGLSRSTIYFTNRDRKKVDLMSWLW